MNLDNFILMEV